MTRGDELPPPCGSGHELPHSGDEAFALLESAHDDFATAVLTVQPQDYARKVAVMHKAGETASDMSPADVVGWLTEHYREHAGEATGMAAKASR